MKACLQCGEFFRDEELTYTSDGTGPVCLDCAMETEAELEEREARTIHRERY